MRQLNRTTWQPRKDIPVRLWSTAFLLFVVAYSALSFAQSQPSAVLSYSTYLGGSGEDDATAMAVDAGGNIYVAGITYSANFPTTPGALQPTSNAGSPCGTPTAPIPCEAGFISKLDPTGTKLLYSTFFPGNPSALTVNADGELYVAGIMTSAAFPITPTGLSSTGKLFVAKLDNTGSTLLMAARFGSSAVDNLSAITLDSSGNIYATGWSYGTDYPVTPGAFQTTSYGAFVTKISADGSQMLYSACLGGSDSFNVGLSGTGPRSIAVDSAGQAFVAGLTDANFPTTTTAFQAPKFGVTNAFLAKLSADGASLLYSTVFGSGAISGILGEGGAYKVAIDTRGFAYISGRALHDNLGHTLPVTAGAFQTGAKGAGAPYFVAKFDPSQSGSQSLVFSTLLDGPNVGIPAGDALASGLALDSNNNVYVTGATAGPVFPTTQNAITGCATTTSDRDVFVAVLNGSGSNLLFGTLVGGSASNAPVGLGLDNTGNVYVAGITRSYDFPVTPGAYQTVNTGPQVTDQSVAQDAFALRINSSVLMQLVYQPNLQPTWQICVPVDGSNVSNSVDVTAGLQAGGRAPLQMTVQIDGAVVNQVSYQSTVHTAEPLTLGVHTITLQADDWGLNSSRTITVVAGNNPAPSLAALSPTSVPAGSSGFTLSVSGSNFVPASVVQWNGQNLSTTFISPVSLTASVSAALVAAPGTAQITVSSPAPGGGVSAGGHFTITSPPTCASAPMMPSVHVCSPAPNASISSPVQVSATAASSPAASLIQVYVDGIKRYQAAGDTVTTILSMNAGAHRITVQAYNGSWFKTSEYVTVTAESQVSVSISPISVTLAPGATQQFTATVTGSTNTAVTWAVDGIVGSNAISGTITPNGLYTAPGSAGKHTVAAISVADTTKSASTVVTVGTVASCTPTGFSPSVTICTPTSGATVSSPLQVTAAAVSSPSATLMQVYVDGVKTYQTAASTLSTSLMLSTGTHRLTVQAYNGTWYKQTEYITVQ